MRRGGLRLGLLVVLCVLACSVQAAQFDFTAGGSATAGVRWTPAVFASVSGSTPDDGRAHFAPVASLGWIDSRNTEHEDLDHNVFLAAGGVRYGWDQGLFASEQIAFTSTRTDALSSRFEFMTSVGWQHGHFIGMLRHVSNAHVIGGGRNLGETMALVGVRI